MLILDLSPIVMLILDLSPIVILALDPILDLRLPLSPPAGGHMATVLATSVDVNHTN